MLAYFQYVFHIFSTGLRVIKRTLLFSFKLIPSIENTVERMFWIKNEHFSPSLVTWFTVAVAVLELIFLVFIFVASNFTLVLELKNIISQRLHNKYKTYARHYIPTVFLLQNWFRGWSRNQQVQEQIVVHLFAGWYLKGKLSARALFCLLQCTFNAFSVQLLQDLFRI